MSTILKGIATAISMILVVFSLAVVSPTIAIGKGNKRTGNTPRFQQGTNLKGRNGSPSGTGLRLAASGTRQPKGLDIGTAERLDLNLKSRNVSPTGTGLRSVASGIRNPKQGTQLLVGGAGGAGSLGLLDYYGSPIQQRANMK